MLNAYRSAVLDDQLGPQLEQAIAQVRGAGTYSLGGLGYKRVPAGFPADHPRAEWLKYNGLHTISPPVSLELASSPQLVDVAISHFLAMAPIQRWLVQVLAHVPAEAE